MWVVDYLMTLIIYNDYLVSQLVMASSEFPLICPTELGKFTRTVGTTAEIQTGHLPDTRQSYLSVQRNKKLSSWRTLERNASRPACHDQPSPGVPT